MKSSDFHVSPVIYVWIALLWLAVAFLGMPGCAKRQVVQPTADPVVEVPVGQAIVDASELEATRATNRDAIREIARLKAMVRDLQDDLEQARRYDARAVCGVECRHRGEPWRDCDGGWHKK